MEVLLQKPVVASGVELDKGTEQPDTMSDAESRYQSLPKKKSRKRK